MGTREAVALFVLFATQLFITNELVRIYYAIAYSVLCVIVLAWNRHELPTTGRAAWNVMGGARPRLGASRIPSSRTRAAIGAASLGPDAEGLLRTTWLRPMLLAASGDTGASPGRRSAEPVDIVVLRAEQLRAFSRPASCPRRRGRSNRWERSPARSARWTPLRLGWASTQRATTSSSRGPTSSGRNTAAAAAGRSGRRRAAAFSQTGSTCTTSPIPSSRKRRRYRPASAAQLQRDLARLVDACRNEVPKAFESESYQERSTKALEPVCAANATASSRSCSEPLPARASR